jgi:hypothetical protein
MIIAGIMMRLFAFLLLTAWAFGQAGSTAPVTITPDLDLKALDCRTQWTGLESCNSFVELLGAKDKDLLGAFGSNQVTIVCFRSDEDAFVLINWETMGNFRKAPDKPNKPSVLLLAPVIAEFAVYSDGVFNIFHSWIDYWKKLPDRSDADAVISATSKDGTFRVDATEVNVSSSYENKLGTTTKHSVSVRRSTGRFSETISAPNKKGGKEDTFDRTGRCLQYPPPAV